MAGPGALLDSYRTAWREASAGQWFLAAGFIFASRILAFNVAFPLYAAAQGYQSAQIGLMLAAVAISLFVFGVPITLLGGRGRSRRSLILGPLIAASGILLVILSGADNFPLALLGCLLAGMASNVYWILGDPILAGVVPPAHRAHVFALKFSLLTLGFAVGGLLGGWIPSILEGAGVAAVPALTGALVAVMVLDLLQSACYRQLPTSVDRHATASRHADGPPPRYTGLAFAGMLLVLLVPEMGMATGYNAIRPYLSLFFNQGFGLSPGRAGTAISVMQLSGGIGALLIPSLAFRIGSVRAMALLRLIAGCTILLAVGAAGLPIVLLMFFTHYSIVDGTGATFVSEVMSRLPASQRTVYAAVAAGAWSVSSAIAASVSGYLQGLTGDFVAAFGLGAAAYFVSAAWLIGVFPRLPPLIRDGPPTNRVSGSGVGAGPSE